jgi:hypothetical protein
VPQRVAVTTSCDDKEADGSDEEHVMTAKCDFKRQARQPNDHFEKLLRATCPNHVYPIKHKLTECTMMKNFMNLNGSLQGQEA